MEGILEYLVADFWERPLPEITPRDIELPALPGKACVTIGMRRSGKTYLLLQQVQRLLSEGVSRERILYLNLEDDRLDPEREGLLSDLLETFFRMSPQGRSERSFLLLDEVQVVPGWERFVRRVLDTEDMQVFVSGSSAKMLSTELATELRGRGFPVEVLPFSPAECARHQAVALPEKWPPGARERSILSELVDRYLEVGGFPEIQHLDPRHRIRILQDYVELVLLRDVVERHGVENATAARYLAKTLIQSASKPFSLNKIYNDFKSQGMRVSKDTLYALLDHFTDAFLCFTVSIFRKSLRSRQVNPRKIYAIDPGLTAAMSHVIAEDRGRRLENAVYLDLRRRFGSGPDETISYYATERGGEVDFVVGDPVDGVVRLLIQVSASIERSATFDREVGALREAMAELGKDSGVIVTLYDRRELEVEEGTIQVIPAWQWLLGPRDDLELNHRSETPQ